MVAGHLREQNGYFQMILSWKGADGKRKSEVSRRQDLP